MKTESYKAIKFFRELVRTRNQSGIVERFINLTQYGIETFYNKSLEMHDAVSEVEFISCLTQEIMIQNSLSSDEKVELLAGVIFSNYARRLILKSYLDCITQGLGKDLDGDAAQ